MYRNVFKLAGIFSSKIIEHDYVQKFHRTRAVSQNMRDVQIDALSEICHLVVKHGFRRHIKDRTDTIVLLLNNREKVGILQVMPEKAPPYPHLYLRAVFDRRDDSLLQELWINLLFQCAAETERSGVTLACSGQKDLGHIVDPVPIIASHIFHATHALQGALMLCGS